MTVSTILRFCVTLCFLSICLIPATSNVWAKESNSELQKALIEDRPLFHPVIAKNGMVVSQNDLATKVGVNILKQGGNAVDAAVAVGFAMAVTLPRAGNLGGGGFMLVYLADSGQTIAIDYRETAPSAATGTMFLDEKGEVDRTAATYSYRSSGIPGTVLGLTYALEKYGTMPLTKVIQPAIDLATKGYPVTDDLAMTINERRELFSKFPETAKIFLAKDGNSHTPGSLLVQRDLAWSLKQIAARGPDAFYKGPIAQKIVADMKANGGLITREDLASYRVIERTPLRTNYKGYDIISMPPPSSGGISIIHTLNILDGFELNESNYNSAEAIHLVAESMKFAYADRGLHMGDPDFVDIPVAYLTDPKHADEQRARIDPDEAIPSVEIADPKLMKESRETTHYSVADRYGNAVSNTYTLNFSYGNGIVAKGTGILMNNEMDDFAAKPGEPNAFGLIASRANAIAPGKRPVSSMSPTIVLKDGKPFLITGSPGGSQIINVVLQVILNVVNFNMNIMEATAAPRFHHQWMPDVLYMEKGFSPDTMNLLKDMGYTIETPNAMGSTQSIMIKDGIFHGAADPRRRDALAEGY